MKRIPRFIPVTAALLALATLTACVAPVPVYQTTRYPYRPAQAAPYPYAAQPVAYAETGQIANIEVLRSESQGYGTSGGGAVALA
ncbi:MAG: hypothetical protein EOO29_57310, partial [Comamonadaceae bacterium]